MSSPVLTRQSSAPVVVKKVAIPVVEKTLETPTVDPVIEQLSKLVLDQVTAIFSKDNKNEKETLLNVLVAIITESKILTVENVKLDADNLKKVVIECGRLLLVQISINNTSITPLIALYNETASSLYDEALVIIQNASKQIRLCCLPIFQK